MTSDNTQDVALADEFALLVEVARKTDADIAYYSGGSTRNPSKERLTELVMAHASTILAALRRSSDRQVGEGGVTQADRDAAAEFIRSDACGLAAKMTVDHVQLAEAFARHRLSSISALEDENARLREALEPFAKAAIGVETFDPEYPMDGAALRASFDWYDKAQEEPLKRHSVRRSDLERARALLHRESDR